MGDEGVEARGKASAQGEDRSVLKENHRFLVCHASPPGFALAPTMQSDIGLIGLAVMGQNLALNIADHGFAISVYNRTTAKTDEFRSEEHTSELQSH